MGHGAAVDIAMGHRLRRGNRFWRKTEKYLGPTFFASRKNCEPVFREIHLSAFLGCLSLIVKKVPLFKVLQKFARWHHL